MEKPRSTRGGDPEPPSGKVLLSTEYLRTIHVK